MENKNEMLLENEGVNYSEKWLKIATYIGIVGASAFIVPYCASPRVDSKTLEEFSYVFGIISYIGEIIFTVIEAILLFLITRKMKSEGIEKPSSLLIYGMIACSILSFGELFYWDDILVYGYIALLLFIGLKFLSNQPTKMIGVSMLLFPVGTIFTVLVADSENHNRVIAILTALPFIAAAKFYLESCKRFLTDKNME